MIFSKFVKLNIKNHKGPNECVVVKILFYVYSCLLFYEFGRKASCKSYGDARLMLSLGINELRHCIENKSAQKLMMNRIIF